MGKVIKGPWASKPELINKDGSDVNYRTMNYFQAIEKQEDAYKVNIFLELYIIGFDYNRTFLIGADKSRTEWQIDYRKNHPQEIQLIKAGLGIY